MLNQAVCALFKNSLGSSEVHMTIYFCFQIYTKSFPHTQTHKLLDLFLIGHVEGFFSLCANEDYAFPYVSYIVSVSNNQCDVGKQTLIHEESFR